MIKLRQALADDLPMLSALCQRSKAHWGYDAAFMAACEAELTFRKSDLDDAPIWIAEHGGTAVGLMQVTFEDKVADLHKLYVEPGAMGLGVGRLLMEHAISEARAAGACDMTIESDPNAAQFYANFGARPTGEVPSGSIPGRSLPLLTLNISQSEVSDGAP